MERIVASYRRKILTVYPGARFDESFTLGCSIDEWANLIESVFDDGMTWENYGEAWVICNVRDRKSVNMQNAEEFYAYFKADQFEPQLNENLPSWLRNLRGKKLPKPEGFNAPGFPGSNMKRPDTAEKDQPGPLFPQGDPGWGPDNPED